jgi:putative ABC transport system permease protein
MRGVAVGRRNLFAERRRAALGVLGVAVALLMILALDGIFAGSMRQITRYIDTSPASVFVAQAGVNTMHMSPSTVPVSAVDEIRALPGVAWAEPILLDSDALVGPGGRQPAYVIGYQPGAPGGPASPVEGREPDGGEIVLDSETAGLIDVGIGDTVEVLGRTWEVAGLVEGMTNIANSIAFVGIDDAAASRGLTDRVSYVLIDGADPEMLADRIEEVTGLTALPRERFSAEEAAIVRDMSTDIMAIMTLAALLIGLVVVGLTLYATTLSRLPEIGVMKALGARHRRLIGIVLSQAMWTVGTALATATALTGLLALAIARAAPSVSLVIEPASVARAAAGAGLLGVIGAIAPLIRVLRIDPASTFRR